jgi:hypothetical protein
LPSSSSSSLSSTSTTPFLTRPFYYNSYPALGSLSLPQMSLVPPQMFVPGGTSVAGGYVGSLSLTAPVPRSNVKKRGCDARPRQQRRCRNCLSLGFSDEQARKCRGKASGGTCDNLGRQSCV